MPTILSRGVRRVIPTEPFAMGPLRVRQPLPAPGLDQISPFVLLHHAGPSHHAPGSPAERLGAHPHRGFEPVTFLYSGGLLHRDSLGNEGRLGPGDVQWMTSGSGILHSEGPDPAFLAQGGELELIQLWVNLPKAYKLVPPRYQDLRKADMPQVGTPDFRLQLVAGELLGQTGPALTYSPVLAAMGEAEAGAQLAIPVPEGWSALVYLLDGEARVGGTQVGRQCMAELTGQGAEVVVEAQGPLKLLLLAGEPIHEPVATYGPFVMNTMEEIREAFRDYQLGRFGTLAD